MCAPERPFAHQAVGVLANRSRLQLVGLLSIKAHTLELASWLEVRVALVARHLPFPPREIVEALIQRPGENYVFPLGRARLYGVGSSSRALSEAQ